MLVPPYRAGEADLKTIFDIKHLKRTAYFLNIQCDLNPLSRSTLLSSIWYFRRPPPYALGRIHLGERLYRKAAVAPRDHGLFLCSIHRRLQRRRNETRKQFRSEFTSQMKDGLEIDVVGPEHGGGAHGCPDRPTV